MNQPVRYLIFGIIALVVVSLAVSFVTKERIYYTTVEGIVNIHSNKWGDETMEFHFQYPHYVESHFLENPGAAANPEDTVMFADGSSFAGTAQLSAQSIGISGTYTMPTGAKWEYNLIRSLNLGGLVGVSGSADLKMSFTKNTKTYTAYISWSWPAVTSVFIQEGAKEKVKLEQHRFDSLF